MQDYVQSLPETLEALETACRDADLERLHQITHGLKGSGGMIGFPALTDAADHFVEIIRRRETERVPQQFERLCNVIHRVIAGHAG